MHRQSAGMELTTAETAESPLGGSCTTYSKKQSFISSRNFTWNQTSVNEFILLGFTHDPKLQILLFVLFLLAYIVTVVANAGIIVVSRLDRNLQTPMYFFICHLSFIDISYSSAITPKTLQTLLAEKKTISFLGCALQLYFYAGFATAECYLLAAMAYDRYVAICKPLLYSVIMRRRLCIQLISASYMGGFVNASIHTISIFRSSFCRSNVINHYFCDGPPLLVITCSDTSVIELVMFICVGFNCISTILVILVSYTYILFSILRIRSAEGRRKAFSTCASHFTAVLIFYGTLLFMYLRPTSSYSMEQDRVVSVFYAVVIPMLNPLIYSLRNKDVKAGLVKVWRQLFTAIRTF
ncbi:olfactory receptor 1019-like [Rhinatrema bivittatum]|uniref:olfactory receptor 1019-like n=1 Tax=Rhinatrema bivittatum TaxID=194408 RepID=UPI001127BE9D|nr:olfactory receptor 1019-like [Rhinatrema bivittatum]